MLPQIRVIRMTRLSTDSSAPISHRSISSSVESFRREIGDQAMLSGGPLVGNFSSLNPPRLCRILGICTPWAPKLCGRRTMGSLRREVRTRSPNANALSLGSWIPSFLTRIIRGRYLPLLKQRSRVKQAQKVRRLVSWAMISSDVCSLDWKPGDRGPYRAERSFSSSKERPMACDMRMAIPTYSQALLPRHMLHSCRANINRAWMRVRSGTARPEPSTPARRLRKAVA